MKKARSPNKNALATLLQSTQRQYKYQQTKQSKPMPSILSKTHDQQHRRNANSIKKVLKQLQDMKKDLNELKRTKKMEIIPEELDNSKCRKLKAETKRSSQSPEGNHSHSSSKRKPSSSQKEISTQTKRTNKVAPKQFSFTGQQRDMRSPQQFIQSEDEDSVEYNPFSLRTHKEGHSHKKPKAANSQSRSFLHKMKVNQQLQSIEASQLYEKYLNSLKNSFSMLQISSPAFTAEDKVKLNVQLQRMSGQIRRIPMYIRQPVQHYENVTIYARNLNNQLNNLAVLLNRCEGRQPRLKQRNIGENYQVTSCKNCDENQKKDLQRYHKREIKRIQKEIMRLQGELDHSREEINVLTTQNLILIKEKDDFSAKFASLQRKLAQQQKKVKFLQQIKDELERQVRDAQGRKLKQVQKGQLQQEDLNYYKTQLDRIKKNGYNLRDLERKQQESNKLISELKEKQLLYQSIIRDKENQIGDLRQKVADLFEELNAELAHQKTNKKQSGQVQIDMYKLRAELQDKNRQLTNSCRQIQLWKIRANKHEARNKQLQSILEQCTAQIKRLHLEINSLEEATENYKEKYLKTRSKNQPKPKRQIQVRSRKQSVFQQLNQLIKNHKRNIENEACNK